MLMNHTVETVNEANVETGDVSVTEYHAITFADLTESEREYLIRIGTRMLNRAVTGPIDEEFPECIDDDDDDDDPGTPEPVPERTKFIAGKSRWTAEEIEFIGDQVLSEEYAYIGFYTAVLARYREAFPGSERSDDAVFRQTSRQWDLLKAVPKVLCKKKMIRMPRESVETVESSLQVIRTNTGQHSIRAAPKCLTRPEPPAVPVTTNFRIGEPIRILDPDISGVLTRMRNRTTELDPPRVLHQTRKDAMVGFPGEVARIIVPKYLIERLPKTGAANVALQV